MNPPSPAEIFDALFVILIPGFLLIAATWFVERKMDAPVDRTPRFGHRVPAAERRLWGDDWRNPVRPFFETHVGPTARANAEAIRDGFLSRNRLIEKTNGNRAAVTAGPLDTRNGDSPCHDVA